MKTQQIILERPFLEAFQNKTSSLTTYLISIYIISLVDVFLLIMYPGIRHWFLVPASLCGIMSLPTIIRWIRGDLDTLDPLVVVSALLLHLTYIAPILHVIADYFAWDLIIRRQDWKYWLGMMSIVNALSIFMFSIIQQKTFKFVDIDITHTFEFRQRRFFFLWLGSITISVVAYIFLLRLIGGYSAYARLAGNDSELSGYGWLLMFSDAMPILLSVGVIYFSNKFFVAMRIKRNSIFAFVIVITLVFIQFLWSGTRGGRNATVFAAFIILGIVHHLYKALKVKYAIFGLIILLVFSYAYGFYKFGGIDTVRKVIAKPDEVNLYREKLRSGNEFGLKWILLFELSRSDVQSFILYRTFFPPNSYRYKLGMTYLQGAVVWVPKKLWPSRPAAPTQVAFTEIKNEYYDTEKLSRRLFGLAGEALMNFGFIGVPIAYGFLGFLLGNFRKHLIFWINTQDLRLYLAPIITLAFGMTIIFDFHSVVFFVFKYGALLISVILLSLTRKS